jgi:hypothetical protein
MNLLKMANDWLTGLDGETYAIGRGLGLILFAVAIGLAVGVTVYAGITSKPSLSEWGAFLIGLGGYFVTVGGAVLAMVSGTHMTEPKSSTAQTTTVTADVPGGTATTTTETTGKPATEII